MRKHKLGKKYSKKLFSKHAVKTRGVNTLSVAPMRGGFRF